MTGLSLVTKGFICKKQESSAPPPGIGGVIRDEIIIEKPKPKIKLLKILVEQEQRIHNNEMKNIIIEVKDVSIKLGDN